MNGLAQLVHGPPRILDLVNQVANVLEIMGQMKRRFRQVGGILCGMARIREPVGRLAKALQSVGHVIDKVVQVSVGEHHRELANDFGKACLGNDQLSP